MLYIKQSESQKTCYIYNNTHTTKNGVIYRTIQESQKNLTSTSTPVIYKTTEDLTKTCYTYKTIHNKTTENLTKACYI